MAKNSTAPGWPAISPRVRSWIIGLNVLLLASWGYLVLWSHNAACGDPGCSNDAGFIILARPDLLIAIVIMAAVFLLNCFGLYYLVGSRLGASTSSGRKITFLVIAGIALIWIASKLLMIQ